MAEKSLYQESADVHETAASEGRRRWIATLAIGNGAALFAVFSLGMKDGALIHPAPSLVGAWLFLFGVVAASYSAIAIAASDHANGLYYRYSHTQSQWAELGDEGRAKALQEMIDQYDQGANLNERLAGWAAIGSGALFICGVGVPLVALTIQHVWS